MKQERRRGAPRVSGTCPCLRGKRSRVLVALSAGEVRPGRQAVNRAIAHSLGSRVPPSSCARVVTSAACARSDTRQTRVARGRCQPMPHAAPTIASRSYSRSSCSGSSSHRRLHGHRCCTSPPTSRRRARVMATGSTSSRTARARARTRQCESWAGSSVARADARRTPCTERCARRTDASTWRSLNAFCRDVRDRWRCSGRLWKPLTRDDRSAARSPRRR